MQFSAGERMALHRAIADGYGRMGVAVTFETPAATPADPLYRETTAGTAHVPWPPIQAVPFERLAPELLTKFGLQADSDYVLLIPRYWVLEWERVHRRPWAVNETLTVLVPTGRRNVTAVRYDPPLATADGTGDWLLCLVETTTKPRMHKRG